MPRYQSSKNFDLPEVDNYALIAAELVDLDVVDSEYDKERGQLKLDWKLADGADTIVRDWVNFSTGKMPDGTVAKLRQLLAALSGTPLTEEPWIDDDTLEYGYGDPATAPVTGKLAEGARVQLRGVVKPKGKNNVDRYVVEVYEAADATPQRRRTAASTPAAEAPAPEPAASPAPSEPAPQPAAAAAPAPAGEPSSFEDF